MIHFSVHFHKIHEISIENKGGIIRASARIKSLPLYRKGPLLYVGILFFLIVHTAALNDTVALRASWGFVEPPFATRAQSSRVPIPMKLLPRARSMEARCEAS